jgi:energy-coupling factor transporter transmembrane protein EcfT
MDKLERYRFNCTLTFGDIYGQIIAWLVVLLISLAAAMGLMGARQPLYALVSVGLVLVLSLPFLLFAFVTTLVNHIEFQAIDPQAEKAKTATRKVSSQQPAQAAG